MVALLYLLTAAVLLGLTHRFFTPLTRGAAAALLLLPLCFTWRAVLTNRIYAPVEMPYISQPLGDHARSLGVGKPHNRRLADIAFQMIPWREATRRSLMKGEWPLLNRFQLCGDVLAGSGQPAVFSPFTLIACVLPAPLSFTYTGVIAFFMAGLGAFLLARELGCRAEASMFAAAGWMFSGPVALMILWPLGFSWNLLPLVLAATHRLVHAPGSRSIALLTISLSLEILAGHPETALHVAAIAFAFGLFELWQERQNTIKVLIAAGASGVLALALTAIYLLPFLDALRQSFEYALRSELWGRSPLRVPAGYAADVLLGDLVPWLRPERWSLPGDAVAGSVIVALAIYSVCFIRTRRTWFFATLVVICLLVGANAWPLAHLLHKVPLFSEALNERMGAAAPLALSILAAFAIDRLHARRAAYIFAALFATYSVVVLMASKPPADVVRLLADLVPAVAAAALLFLRPPSVAILFALLLGQRIVADGSLVPVHDARIAYPRLALFRPMEEINEPFRAAGYGSLLLPNTATMYGFEDVRGSTAVTLRSFAETYPLWSTVGAGQFHSIPDLTRPILSMMNLRFALIDVSDPIPAGWHHASFEVWTRLIENERVLPRAFIPRLVRIGSKQELDEMAVETDFSERAWLAIDDQPHDRVNGGGQLSVRRRGSRLEIDVTKEGDGFVVISEAAWNGWRADLDGKRVTVIPANHAFLAVFVPSGHHKIVLRYWPRSFVIGRWITFAAIALLSALSLRERVARSAG
ncbi:MAG TPA: YfhO family protein [Thermoanaerobaculia bacterium]|nr:YfhO family protein [Thermoanaerobaculia bacterium]